MKTEDKLIAALGGIVECQKFLVGLRPNYPSIGQRIQESPELKSMLAGPGRITIDLQPHEVKTAITSSGALNDPLAPSGTPTLDYGARRNLFLQDLLPSFPTQNGAIEIPVSASKTNNAGPQVGGSPEQRENVTIGESGYTFTNSFEPVETIAHFIPASKQILEDSGQLNAFIHGEMLYGLAEATEDQLLNGDGTTGELNGLMTNATAWANESPNIANPVDILRSAIKQVRLANFAPSGIILNEADWYDIETRKHGASADSYVAGAPRLGGEPSLWGLPVHVSNLISAGSFLVADLNRCAIIFDRQLPRIEVSRHDGDSFSKGMLTFMASTRMALVNVNPLAAVTGAL